MGPGPVLCTVWGPQSGVPGVRVYTCARPLIHTHTRRVFAGAAPPSSGGRGRPAGAPALTFENWLELRSHGLQQVIRQVRRAVMRGGVLAPRGAGVGAGGAGGGAWRVGALSGGQTAGPCARGGPGGEGEGL